jgi:hypothetical protein
LFHVAVEKRRITPLQLQHWPARLLLLTIVHAAVHLPLVVVLVAVKP